MCVGFFEQLYRVHFKLGSEECFYFDITLYLPQFDKKKIKNNHKLIQILQEVDQFSKDENIKCTLCIESDIEKVATLICKAEKKFLCNECGNNHKLDDSIKHHKIARLQDDKMICDLCLDSSIPGYGFCLDCEHPEVLCLPCSKRHCSNEEFANHEICNDLNLMTTCER